MDSSDLHRFIFAGIFLLANKLQLVSDYHLAGDGITVKQLMLLITIAQFKQFSPTLNEAAEMMGSSHQNVKQLALKLEKRGFVKIEKDPRDARASCLKLTAECDEFFNKNQDSHAKLMSSFFETLSADETSNLYQGINKTYQHLMSISQTMKLEKPSGTNEGEEGINN